MRNVITYSLASVKHKWSNLRFIWIHAIIRNNSSFCHKSVVQRTFQSNEKCYYLFAFICEVKINIFKDFTSVLVFIIIMNWWKIMSVNYSLFMNDIEGIHRSSIRWYNLMMSIKYIALDNIINIFLIFIDHDLWKYF